MIKTMPTQQERDLQRTIHGDAVNHDYAILDKLDHAELLEVREAVYKAMGGDEASAELLKAHGLGVTLVDLNRLSNMTYDYMSTGEQKAEYNKALQRLNMYKGR